MEEPCKTEFQRRREKSHKIALEKAALWHRQQKDLRIQHAYESAQQFISNLDLDKPALAELALAMLYWGEGFKTNNGLGIGNSDPQVLKFFIQVLNMRGLFNVEKVICELHLRHDQNVDECKDYWSQELGIPLNRFTSISVDIRTKGKSTYPHYKGVCIVRCGNVAAQRRLIFIYKLFCEKILTQRAVSSADRAPD